MGISFLVRPWRNPACDWPMARAITQQASFCSLHCRGLQIGSRRSLQMPRGVFAVVLLSKYSSCQGAKTSRSPRQVPWRRLGITSRLTIQVVRGQINGAWHYFGTYPRFVPLLFAATLSLPTQYARPRHLMYNPTSIPLPLYPTPFLSRNGAGYPSRAANTSLRPPSCIIISTSFPSFTLWYSQRALDETKPGNTAFPLVVSNAKIPGSHRNSYCREPNPRYRRATYLIAFLAACYSPIALTRRPWRREKILGVSCNMQTTSHAPRKEQFVQSPCAFYATCRNEDGNPAGWMHSLMHQQGRFLSDHLIK